MKPKNHFFKSAKLLPATVAILTAALLVSGCGSKHHHWRAPSLAGQPSLTAASSDGWNRPGTLVARSLRSRLADSDSRLLQYTSGSYEESLWGALGGVLLVFLLFSDSAAFCVSSDSNEFVAVFCKKPEK